MKTNTATIPVLDEPTELDSTSDDSLGLRTLDQADVKKDAHTGIPARDAEPLAELKALNVWFDDSQGERRHVVHNLDLSIRPGECVAIIGESGSGKSVTARTLIGLTGDNAHIEADQARVLGHDIAGLKDRHWKGIRGRHVGFILQDYVRWGQKLVNPYSLTEPLTKLCRERYKNSSMKWAFRNPNCVRTSDLTS